MNFLKRSLWVAVAAAAFAGTASAQGIGGLGGTTTGGGGGAGGGAGGAGGGAGGGGGMGGGGGGGAGGSTGTGSTTTAGSSGTGAINLTPPSSYAQAPQSIATSNNIAKFYANPYYQGRAGVTSSNYISVVSPGGFGAPLYGTSFGASSSTTGGGGGRGGAGGAAGGFGGSAGGAGGGGFGTTTGGNARGGAMGGLNGGSTTQQSGQVVNPGVVGISYTASIKFDRRIITPDQLQSDLQAAVNRSTYLSNPAAVQVFAGANGAVTIRGRAKDADEARLVEGLLRLTPGVHTIANELTFPAQ